MKGPHWHTEASLLITLLKLYSSILLLHTNHPELVASNNRNHAFSSHVFRVNGAWQGRLLPAPCGISWGSSTRGLRICFPEGSPPGLTRWCWTLAGGSAWAEGHIPRCLSKQASSAKHRAGFQRPEPRKGARQKVYLPFVASSQKLQSIPSTDFIC